MTTIDGLINSFDDATVPFLTYNVRAAIQTAYPDPEGVEGDEAKSVHADWLAMSLAPYANAQRVWGTYFGPMGSSTAEDGTVMYFPDLKRAGPWTIEQWVRRATELSNPVLKARYADLVWDLGATITKSKKRDGRMAGLAVDAYLEASVALSAEQLLEAFLSAERALQVAIEISDTGRRDAARTQVLRLHQLALERNELWWRAFDVLADHPKSGASSAENDQLVADLETCLARYGDTLDETNFDPHFVNQTTERLLKVYERSKRREDERRIHLVAAKSAERHAELAGALAATSILNDCMAAYAKAGEKSEAERIRRLLAKRVQEAKGEMQEFSHSVPVSREEMQEFLGQFDDKGPGRVLMLLASQFMLRRKSLEEGVENSKHQAPLLATLTQSIIKDDMVVASVGSVDEDPYGRLMAQARQRLDFDAFWLGHALPHVVEAYKLGPADLHAWANRAGLFRDGALLAEGLHAWLEEGDLAKAVFILVPQIEAGFRELVNAVGRPTTKRHPRFAGAQVVSSMGDMLFDPETVKALGSAGEDLVLHFVAVFADSRGLNIRNEAAHGMLAMNDMSPKLANWLIHAVLLLGAFRSPKDNTPAAA